MLQALLRTLAKRIATLYVLVITPKAASLPLPKRLYLARPSNVLRKSNLTKYIPGDITLRNYQTRRDTLNSPPVQPDL
jgi:hypothetical protein